MEICKTILQSSRMKCFLSITVTFWAFCLGAGGQNSLTTRSCNQEAAPRWTISRQSSCVSWWQTTASEFVCWYWASGKWWIGTCNNHLFDWCIFAIDEGRTFLFQLMIPLVTMFSRPWNGQNKYTKFSSDKYVPKLTAAIIIISIFFAAQSWKQPWIWSWEKSRAGEKRKSHWPVNLPWTEYKGHTRCAL